MKIDHAQWVRSSLTDPARLCVLLGWSNGHRRQSRGVLIRCPVHGERNPSCSVTVTPSGTIGVKCFGCDWSGDALTMIAVAHGLSLTENFAEVLAVGAELSGDHGLAEEIRAGRCDQDVPIAATRLAPVPLSTSPPPEYPPQDELTALWSSCADPDTDAHTVKLLMSRAINFELVSSLKLARVVTSYTIQPSWARYKGKSWFETGHRLLLPAFDSAGVMRSVRAWRVIDGDTPKRLPPGGCKASGLAQANWQAVKMLRRWLCPLRLYIVEGEPDALTASTTFAETDAVIGIGSGSWTEGFARNVPLGTRVYVSTHADDAGDRYAEQILGTFSERHMTFRWRVAA